MKLAALLLTALLATGAAHGASPIEGAFGLKLGDVFEPTTAPDYEIGESNAYPFTPKEPNPAFSRFYVWITPVSHVIWQIGAIGSAADRTAREQASDRVKALISQKYSVDEPMAGLVIQANRTVLVAAGRPQVGENEYYITYHDTTLSGQGAKERNDIEIQQRARQQAALVNGVDGAGL